MTLYWQNKNIFYKSERCLLSLPRKIKICRFATIHINYKENRHIIKFGTIFLNKHNEIIQNSSEMHIHYIIKTSGIVG